MGDESSEDATLTGALIASEASWQFEYTYRPSGGFEFAWTCKERPALRVYIFADDDEQSSAALAEFLSDNLAWNTVTATDAAFQVLRKDEPDA